MNPDRLATFVKHYIYIYIYIYIYGLSEITTVYEL